MDKKLAEKYQKLYLRGLLKTEAKSAQIFPMSSAAKHAMTENVPIWLLLDW